MSSIAETQKPSLIQVCLREGAKVSLGVLFMFLCSRISLELFFSPVPITMQTFGVFLIAALFGSKRGALTMLAFIGAVAAGLPAMKGGLGGPGVFVLPSAGFVFGFVPAAFVTGWILEQIGHSFPRALFAMALGNLCLYCVGLPWLALWVGWSNVWVMGVLPFIAGSTAKWLAAAGGYRQLQGPLRSLLEW